MQHFKGDGEIIDIAVPVAEETGEENAEKRTQTLPPGAENMMADGLHLGGKQFFSAFKGRCDRWQFECQSGLEK